MSLFNLAKILHKQANLAKLFLIKVISKLIIFITDYGCIVFICLTQSKLELCNAFVSKHCFT